MQSMNINQAKQVLESVPVGVLLLNQERQITWANPACHVYFGIPAGELAGKKFSLIDETVLQRVVGQEGVYYVPAAGERAERWLQCRDQAVEQGEAKYFIDITELRRVQAQQERIAHQLQELATLDPNTGLFTPRALMQNLEPLVSRSRRYNNPLSVVVMAVAGLADYNHRPQGPNAQQVLLAVGHLLKDQLRWADIISRSSSNEFVMVLPETSTEAAQKLIDKVRSHLGSLAIAGAPEAGYAIDARFGVASWQKGDDAQQLLQRGYSAVAR